MLVYVIDDVIYGLTVIGHAHSLERPSARLKVTVVGSM